MYQINSSFLIRQFERYTKGTTRPRINLSVVRELKFNLPPIKEQHRIVFAIEELFSDLDNSVANLKLAQNQLKVYRQALLKYAFEGKLTEKWRKENNPEDAKRLLERIKAKRKKRFEDEFANWEVAVKQLEKDGKRDKKPEKPKYKNHIGTIINNEIRGWCNATIEEVCTKITDGSHNPPKKVNNGFPMLSARNIEDNKINFKDFRLVEEKAFNAEYSRADVEQGNVLLTIVGTIGRTAVVPANLPKFTLQRSVALLKQDIDGRYLSYVFQNPIFKKQLIDEAKGTAQKGVYLTTLRSLIIPLCSELEQVEIVNHIELQFTLIDKLEDSIMSGLLKSEALRHSILKKAFEGKLVEQDSNEESAIELFKRVKTEKEEYLKKLNLDKKKAPLKIKKMSKELSIEEVLKTSQKPMLAVDVWQQSKHKDNIEEFYAELKKIQENIKEVKNGTESLISLKA